MPIKYPIKSEAYSRLPANGLAETVSGALGRVGRPDLVAPGPASQEYIKAEINP